MSSHLYSSLIKAGVGKKINQRVNKAKEQLHSQVTSAGNPIIMDLKTRYKVKGIGAEQTITSVIKIHTDTHAKCIQQVEDRWDGEIPEGPFAKVSSFSDVLVLVSLGWWIRYMGQCLWFVFCWIAWTRGWRVGCFSLPPPPDCLWCTN
jgi:hypothetical protein